MLPACASTQLTKVSPAPAPTLVQPDSRLTKKCDSPVVIPKGATKQSDVEKLWGGDRVALVNCRDGKQALVQFYHDRDARLMKNPGAKK
jgi:hypothetical protein